MPEQKSVRLALPQLRMSKDVEANLDAAVASVRTAAAGGAHIVALPELCTSLYFCQVEDAAFCDLAEPAPGRAVAALAAAARAAGVVVVAPVFERRAAGVYHNSAFVIDADGQVVGHYRKMHIPDDPQYYEKFYFTPGDLGFKAWQTRFGKIGVCVCWDQWYPEAARLTAMQGADIIFYPTAIGWLPADRSVLGAAQRDAWETVQRGHAIANGVFVAATNRCGLEGDPQTGIEFWGNSFVADPQGVVLARAGAAEEILFADLDPGRVEEVRRGWPFFRDRRIDAYGGLTERWLGR